MSLRHKFNENMKGDSNGSNVRLLFAWLTFLLLFIMLDSALSSVSNGNKLCAVLTNYVVICKNANKLTKNSQYWVDTTIVRKMQ